MPHSSYPNFQTLVALRIVNTGLTVNWAADNFKQSHFFIAFIASHDHVKVSGCEASALSSMHRQTHVHNWRPQRMALQHQGLRLGREATPACNWQKDRLAAVQALL